MRLIKGSLLAVFALVLGIGSAAWGVEGEPSGCDPHPRTVGPLHIAYINCDAEADEVVIVVNGSPKTKDLTGYRLTNASQGATFHFRPSPVNDGCCTLEPHESFRIHTGLRNLDRFESPYDLHWLRSPGQPEPERVWRDAGDVAQLIAPDGEVVDTYRYGQR